MDRRRLVARYIYEYMIIEVDIHKDKREKKNTIFFFFFFFCVASTTGHGILGIIRRLSSNRIIINNERVNDISGFFRWKLLPRVEGPRSVHSHVPPQLPILTTFLIIFIIMMMMMMNVTRRNEHVPSFRSD